MKPRVCELCKGEASLYCESDSAFLCWTCDARVHEANFLVARHVRTLVCSECRGLNADRPVSGVGFGPVRCVCRSCESRGCPGSPSSDSLSSSVSSSSCISSAESASSAGTEVDQTRWGKCKISMVSADPESTVKVGCLRSTTDSEFSNRRGRRRRRSRGELDARAEGIVVNWCRSLGLDGQCAVALASHALGVGARKMTVTPFRLYVAAAVWFSAKLLTESKGGRTCGVLKQLEACSGVPAKLIVLAESKLCRCMRKCHVEKEEGWAESTLLK